MLLYELIVHPNVAAVLPLLQKAHMRMWKDEENKDGQSHTTAFTPPTPHRRSAFPHNTSAQNTMDVKS